MSRTIRLEQIHIASPCPVSWDSMEGDDCRRFCSECQLKVYNLSAMTREEAETLISETEGRVCAGFYRRSDGTILTRDCPVGLRAGRRRMAKVAGRVAAAVAVAFGGVVFGRSVTEDAAGKRSVHELPAFSAANRWLTTESPPVMPRRRWTGGIVCVRPAPSPPSSGPAVAPSQELPQFLTPEEIQALDKPALIEQLTVVASARKNYRGDDETKAKIEEQWRMLRARLGEYKQMRAARHHQATLRRVLPRNTVGD